MTGPPNEKRRHTRLNIELKAVLGFDGGEEREVRTDNLSFSGARFTLAVPCRPVLPEFIGALDITTASHGVEVPDQDLDDVSDELPTEVSEAASEGQANETPLPDTADAAPLSPSASSTLDIDELPSALSGVPEPEQCSGPAPEPQCETDAEPHVDGTRELADPSPSAAPSPVEEPDPEPAPDPGPAVPLVAVAIPDDILSWVDLTLPNSDEPIRLSVREIRRTDDALMVEFVDSTFTEYSLYKNFLMKRGLESGSDLKDEFEANPHLAENFELEFNNRKLGQVLEILYGLTSREVKTAIAEQRQSGRRLGDILIGWGRITKQQLQAAIAVSKSGQDTLFSQFFLKVLPGDMWQRFWQLFGEGTSIVLVTLGVMAGLGGIPQGGLISVFLVSTALTSRIESILQHQSGRQRGRELLGLFLGLFVGYGLVSLLFNADMVYRMFEVLLNSNGVNDTETLFDRKFHSLLPIMANNLMVLISGCILSFCFRQYGVLLTLVWNACLWGVSLVTLVTQTLDRIQSDLAVKVVGSTFSLLPHLAIEALGYIYAASAAYGISKAVMWGPGARAQQRRAITKYMVQIIIGALLIIGGAFLESYWVPWSMRAIMLGVDAA